MQLFIRLFRLEHSVLLNTRPLPSDGGLQQGRGARVGDLGCPIGRQLPILILLCASTIMVLGHQTHSSLSFIEWSIFILSRAAAPPFCQNLHLHFQLVYMYSCPHYYLTSTTPTIQLDGCRRWGKSTSSARTNGWALSVKRAIPINRLFKSRRHALGAYRSRSGRFENLDQWEVGID